MDRSRPPFPPLPPVGHVIQMRSAIPDAAAVFVEGPDDVDLWRRWLTAKPVALQGRDRVIAALIELRDKGLRGCVGIVDGDIDRDELAPVDAQVVVSQYADHECDLVYSPAFDCLMSRLPEVGSTLKEDAANRTLRERIVACAIEFGALRLWYKSKRIEFPDRLNPNRPEFIDRECLCVRVEVLRNEAAALAGVSRVVLDSELAQIQGGRAAGLCAYFNGHDVVSLVRLVISLTPQNAKFCRSEQVVAWNLRGALDTSHLDGFPMWVQLGEWEGRNAPFRARRAVGAK